MNEERRPDLRLLFSSPEVFLALGGGTGLSPVAPGTAGSLLGIPLAVGLELLSAPLRFAIWLALVVLGCWFCDRAGRALGQADHPAIVWDEICGQSIVLVLAPHGWGWIVAGFIAFRLFDILKPFPIHLIDRRWQNGVGVMADDLMAAVYAIVCLVIGYWAILQM